MTESKPGCFRIRSTRTRSIGHPVRFWRPVHRTGFLRQETACDLRTSEAPKCRCRQKRHDCQMLNPALRPRRCRTTPLNCKLRFRQLCWRIRGYSGFYSWIVVATSSLVNCRSIETARGFTIGRSFAMGRPARLLISSSARFSHEQGRCRKDLRGGIRLRVLKRYDLGRVRWQGRPQRESSRRNLQA